VIVPASSFAAQRSTGNASPATTPSSSLELTVVEPSALSAVVVESAASSLEQETSAIATTSAAERERERMVVSPRKS
jgi:hypothetical protein